MFEVLRNIGVQYRDTDMKLIICILRKIETAVIKIWNERKEAEMWKGLRQRC